MGSNQSVNLKDYQYLFLLMKQINEDNKEMIDIGNMIKQDEKILDKTLGDDFFEKYNKMLTICDKPKFIFWFSEQAREECKQSKLATYYAARNIVVDVNKKMQSDEFLPKLNKRITRNNLIIETNKNL